MVLKGYTVIILSVLMAFASIEVEMSIAQESNKAEKEIRIAVLEFMGNGVPKSTASAISNLLEADVVNIKNVTLIERKQIELILKEQGFQQSGCTDSSCAVEIGKLISVNKLIVGEVLAIGGTNFIMTRMVDIGSGKVEFSYKKEYKGENELLSGISDTSLHIKMQIEGRNRIETAKVEKKDTRERRVNFEIGPIVEGKAPAGITVSYGYYRFNGDEVKEYYNALQGGGVGYVYGINDYLGAVGSAFLSAGGQKEGEAMAMLGSLSLGPRVSLPLWNFAFPYMGIAARLSWLRESRGDDSAFYPAWGADASAGIAFRLPLSLGLFAECAYSIGRVVDDNSSDISGLLLSTGLVYSL